MTSIELIAAERERQISEEGWTAQHDDGHTRGQLSEAGACYATAASAMVRGAEPEEFSAEMLISEGEWPWDEEWWKPSPDPIRNLVKAGALIAAEIDRLQRKGQPGATMKLTHRTLVSVIEAGCAETAACRLPHQPRVLVGLSEDRKDLIVVCANCKTNLARLSITPESGDEK